MSAHDDPKTLGPTRLGFADAREVQQFVETLEEFERGAIGPDAWRAFRLVNGIYGQRQEEWSMVRVKIPQGILTGPQLRALADVAERWSKGKGHVTTRQNVQFHFVKLADSGRVIEHLAAAGLTTREACGNSVRNITACPYAGVSATEPFDVTPYAEALTRHLLRGPLSSTLPRKFKIAFGGCCGHDCVNAAINDLGFLARRAGDRIGFHVTIGGGTATLPRSGFVAHEFLPAEELLEAAEAVVRVFHRLGNREDKGKARLKFVIETLGRAGFLAEYARERAAIAAEGGRRFEPAPQPPPPALRPAPARPPEAPEGSREFVRDNVRAQKQRGFASVAIRLPLGDVTAAQLRALAGLVTTYSEGELRTTHEQNLVLRFVPAWQVAALYAELREVGLGRAGARTVADVTSCPGAASCRIAVTASRGLAALLTGFLEERPEMAARARSLSLKVSGCPNGCGQHHIAGIGFQGGVRKVDGKAVPQYHVLLGGGIGGEGARFGRLAAKVPARRVPDVVERLINLYDAEKAPSEPPDLFFARLPLERAQALLADLVALDAQAATPEDFVDLGEEQAFVPVVKDGECAA